MISLGLLQVPAHLYEPRYEDFPKTRKMTSEERLAITLNIIKHKTTFGDSGTCEFIYYEMIDSDEIPKDKNGTVIVNLHTFNNYYKTACYQVKAKYTNEKKICEWCKKEYERLITMPFHKWNKQRFCSRKCACLDTVHNRTIKQNERKQAAG